MRSYTLPGHTEIESMKTACMSFFMLQNFGRGFCQKFHDMIRITIHRPQYDIGITKIHIATYCVSIFLAQPYHPG